MLGNVLVPEVVLTEITYIPMRTVGSTLGRLERSGGLEETMTSARKIGCFWRDFGNIRNLEALLSSRSKMLSMISADDLLSSHRWDSTPQVACSEKEINNSTLLMF